MDECEDDWAFQDANQRITVALASTALIGRLTADFQKRIAKSLAVLEESRALMIEVSQRHVLGRPWIGNL